MQALMLAAGMGKRLGRYTSNNTKCMLKVNDKYIPYNKDFITKIDKANKKIYMHDIEVFL